jgi:branched-subunit amino acid permease
MGISIEAVINVLHFVNLITRQKTRSRSQPSVTGQSDISPRVSLGINLQLIHTRLSFVGFKNRESNKLCDGGGKIFNVAARIYGGPKGIYC